MSPPPPLRWWAEPVRPNRYLNLSPITLALASVAALDMAILLVVRATYPDGRTVPVPLAPLVGAAALSLLCAAPFGVISLIRDLFSGGRLERRRVAEQGVADAAAAKAQAELVQRGLVRDLRACYQAHHHTLVDQARVLLVKNRYGRYDTAAFTAELEHFQQHVVRPELAAKGYPEEMITGVFEAQRDQLVAEVLKPIAQAEREGVAP